MAHSLGACELAIIHLQTLVHVSALSADEVVLLCRSCSPEQRHVNFTNIFQANVTQPPALISSTILSQWPHSSIQSLISC